jgi:large subunit ribosomal protein L33
MSQDNQVKLECSGCGTVNYFTTKNKKKLPGKLELKKFCKHCGAQLMHKETK